jgi:hypothetical protein
VRCGRWKKERVREIFLRFRDVLDIEIIVVHHNRLIGHHFHEGVRMLSSSSLEVTSCTHVSHESKKIISTGSNGS